MKRMTAFLRNAAAVFLITSIEVVAQTPIVTVVNDFYNYRVEEREGVPLLLVDGFSPVSGDRRLLPTRFVDVPCEDGSCNTWRIVSYSLGASFSATPFVKVRHSLDVDSSIVSTPGPVADAPDAASYGSPSILSSRGVRDAGGTHLRLELPLLVFDAGSGRSQWIDSIVLAPDAGRETAVQDASPFEGPYTAQPFIRRGARHLDTTGAWMDFRNPNLRFFVKNDGLHRLTKQWFEASGFSTAGIDPASYRLWRKGVEIPMLSVGLDDGIFDDADYFVFPGERNYNGGIHRHVPSPDSLNEPYHEYMNIYSDSTAYWLTSGAGRGARIPLAGGGGSAASDTLDWAYQLHRFEENAVPHTLNIYQDRIQDPEWLSEETWIGNYMKSNGISKYPFYDIPRLKEGKDSRLWVKVLTWYTESSTSPHFRVMARTPSSGWLDSADFDINGQGLLRGIVPAGELRSGIDSVLVWNKQLTERKSELVLDWVELEYPAILAAAFRRLRFAVDPAMGSGRSAVRIMNVTTRDAVLIRVGPAGSKAINDFTVNMERSELLFSDTLAPGATYYFAELSGLLSPSDAAVVTPPDLRQAASQGDYIIITARELAQPAVEYGAFIEREYGVKANVFSVEDIYDNYSYGMFNPEAIKLFLLDAVRKWKTIPPRYVFLVGDANWNLKAVGRPYSRNYVPSFGSPSSDPWFVCFDSLSIDPVLDIGRLPAATGDDIRRYKDKHSAYLAMEPDIFNKTTIHFSGGDPNQGEGRLTILRNANDRVIRNVVEPPPLSGKATHFYKTINPPTNFGPVSPEYYVRTIDEGAVMISYVGHSGTDIWDNGISDASQIANKRNRMSLITDFGCSSGKFSEPDIVSFSEKFVIQPEGQAIAYVGNASLGFESTSGLLPMEFYGALISDNAPTIGAGHRISKRRIIDRYGQSAINRIAMKTNTLIGDPIIRIDFPAKPNLVATPEWIQQEAEVFTDAVDSLGFNVKYMNYGRASADSMSVVIEDYQRSALLFRHSFRVPVPGLIDSAVIFVPRGNITGNRRLRITVDADGEIEELKESDNTAETEYYVYSTHLKAVNRVFGAATGNPDQIAVLNPINDPGPVTNILFEFDTSPGFENPLSAPASYDKTRTVLSALPSLPPRGKAHWRASLDLPERRFAGPFSYWPDIRSAAFVQKDSADFKRGESFRARYYENRGMSVLPPYRVLRVSSAGRDDGSFATVEIDGFNLLSTTYFVGYGVVVFDSITFEMKRQDLFFTYDLAAERDRFRAYLDSVQSGEIAAVVSSHEPQRGIGTFAGALRSLGSAYTDSISQRGQFGSWAMIGWRGAATGSVPEGFGRRGTGRVDVDTVFTAKPDTAVVFSPLVGPSAEWRSLRLERTDSDSTSIRIAVLAVDSTGAETEILSGENPDTLDISSIDASVHRYLRLRAEMAPKHGVLQPALNSWAVDYRMLPELAVNYQSVTVREDTLEQGNDAIIDVGVLNAGDSPAASFPVQVDLVDENNVRQTFAVYTIGGLASNTWHDTAVVIPTPSLSRSRQVIVVVDRDNVVQEQFEDNNVATTRFFVRTDTARPQLDVLFDGRPSMNGDIVSPTPRITCVLKDRSPLKVTSCENFTVILNDEALPCTGRNFEFTPASGNTDATLSFVPEPPLEPGDHVFAFNVKDASGNPAYDADMRITVRVVAEKGIRDVFAYPTPFKENTTFTFVLTGATRFDELEIKIYTVAGRLIRTLAPPVDFSVDDVRIGLNAVRWDGRDADGDQLANGVYFFKIIARGSDGSQEHIGRIAVLR